MAVAIPQVERRQGAFLDLYDGQGSVLEIGAYDRPITNGLSNVKYADYFDYEELLRQANSQQGRDPESVNDVNYVLSQMELSEIVDRFDFVVASHVFEHVPNPLNWLNSVANLLNPGGILWLALPHKDFTFDRYRPTSTIGHFLNLEYLEQNKPLPGDVFDARFRQTVINPKDVWENGYSVESQVYSDSGGIDNRFESAKGALFHSTKSANEYHDCHVSVFTEKSFFDVFTVLGPKCLNKMNLHIDFIQTVSYPFNDFFVVLKKAL